MPSKGFFSKPLKKNAQNSALETGRWVARTTLTGQTAITSPLGQLTAQIPRGEYGMLSSELVPMSGATPFVLWGNRPIVGFIVLVLIWPLLAGAISPIFRFDRA